MSAENNSNLSLNIAIILAVLSPAIVLMQATFSSSPPEATGMSGATTVEERIRPVVTLADVGGAEDAQQGGTAMAAAKTPASMYQGACMACHAVGVANAPKFGDQAAWAPKAALGLGTLVASVVNGKGAMPPGGGSAYSEDEIRVVVEYMLAEAGLSAN